MKPSERIGNLLYNEKGEVTEVESVTKTHINGVELSKWRPIPINDMLDKLYLTQLSMNCYVCRETGISIESPKEIKYIHHMQNLYYDLTQTDLIIKI